MAWVTVLFLAAVSAVAAFPQQTPYSNTTFSPSSSALATTTPAAQCSPSCFATPPGFVGQSWLRNNLTTTVTLATVITIINTRLNTTRYVTKTAVVPKGIELPPTNENGTAYCIVTAFGTLTTVAYPTVLNDYAKSYLWSGVLPTTRANETEVVCSTASKAWVTFSSHPNYNSYLATHDRTSSTTTPTNTPIHSTYDPLWDDPRGLNYRCEVEHKECDWEFIDAQFPDEYALHNCIPPSIASPAQVMLVAGYLIASSVSYEDDDVEATKVPEIPRTERSEKPIPPTLTGHRVQIEESATAVPLTTVGLIEPSTQDETTVPNTKKPITPPAPTSTQDGTTIPHTEKSGAPSVPTPAGVVTSLSHTEQPVTVGLPVLTSNQEVTETAHTERSETALPPSPTSKEENANTDLPVTVLPSPPTSFESTPAFAHTEISSSPEPPSPTSKDSATESTVLTVPIVTTVPGASGSSLVVTTHSSFRVPATAHIESSVTKLIPPSVITIAPTAHIESSVTAVDPPTVITIVPTEHIESSAEVIPPSKTVERGFTSAGGAPPKQTISIGSTAVVVVPTSISRTVDGTSTNVPAVLVGSSILTAGQAVTADNTPVAVPAATFQPQSSLQDQPPVIVIGDFSTVVLPTAPVPSPPALAIGGETIHPFASANIISGATLAPDSPITLGTGSSATVLAITTNAAGHSVVLVGTSAAPFVTPAPAVELSAPVLTVAGQTVRPSDDGNHAAYVFSGHTLEPGSPVTLGSGLSTTVLAITTDSAGNSVVAIGTNTVPFVAATSIAVAPLVLGTQTITPNGDAYVVAGQSLFPGSTITLGTGASATIIALSTDSAGERVALVATGDGSTQTQTQAPASTTGLAPLTLLPGQTVAPEGSAYVVDGKALLPGSTVTVGSGTEARTVALTTDEAGRTVAVEGGRTQTLGAGTTTRPKSPSSALSSERRTTSAKTGRPSGTGSAATTTSSEGAAAGNVMSGMGKRWGAGVVGVGVGLLVF